MSAITSNSSRSGKYTRKRKEKIEDADVERYAGCFGLRRKSPGKETNSTVNLNSGRRDILARDGPDHMHTLKEETIFESTQHHISYTVNGNTLEGLDKYNDCTPYGVSQEGEKDYVQKETHRLLLAAKENGAYLFDSSLQFNSSPGIAFQEMSDLADQMKCAMGIIRLDNASISIQHCTNELQDTIHNFRHARSRLIGRFNPEQSRVRGCGPKKLLPSSRNTALYHALVDYMTASVARTLVRTAVSDYWSKHTLSCLASCSVKMKILAYNLEKSADTSISNAEHALEEMNEFSDSKEGFLVKIRAGPYEELKEIDTLDTETDTSRRYHEEKTIFNKRVWGLLRQILYDLLRSETQSTAADCFQVHATVYKAGLDSSQTILSIGRLGEVESSAEPLVLKNSFTSMELMIKNARKIEELRSSPLTVIPNPEKSGTTIDCEWVNADSEKKSWKTTLKDCVIDEVLSIMVPLSLGRPTSSVSLAMMLSLASSATDEEDPILQYERPPEDFRSFMTVTTGKWKEKEHTTQRWKDPDVMPLTKKRIRYGIRAETENMAPSNNTKLKVPDQHQANKVADVLNDFERNSSAMRAWVIAEDSITFDCHTYVFICVTLALFVVCAGIAIPFVVRDRIKGVDPFQITIFTWMVAGFIILIAKGRYVNEWPWHEFIHGHVICRSLKEVCDATRINDQTVLMYLLLNEWRIILHTRGPHNGMFSRRAVNADPGFAINRPVHISTMMASGFIIVKILNLFGEHLVCLDTRRGSSSIMLRGVGTHLAYVDFENNQDPAGNQIKRLEHRKVIVDRVLGAYVGESYFG